MVRERGVQKGGPGKLSEEGLMGYREEGNPRQWRTITGKGIPADRIRKRSYIAWGGKGSPLTLRKERDIKSALGSSTTLTAFAGARGICNQGNLKKPSEEQRLVTNR